MADSDAGRARWQQRYDQAAKRDADFTTLSGVEVDPVYGPPPGAVVPDMDRIGWPGQYPFTRGLYATGYRGKPWTIRQFSGFGNARQTNERYKMLLRAGGAGLSVAFDMPTLMGRDSDESRSLGEVGHCGVAIDSAADLDVLFEGIPLAETTTSMTISGPAVPVFCMYLVAAERQGADVSKLDGTLQTDIFKEYIAQKEWLFPPQPHLRLIGDLMEYCGANVPRYKPLSVSGYHIREAGSTAAQELACPGGWISRSSRRACRSSSTRTSTSSRRSRSSAPPGGSGPAGCGTSTGRRPNGLSGCASTPRRPASR
jgi:methylmalonyl-CoA mutase N-terminal domain/subunit